MVKLRLKRMGKKKSPYYRIVAADIRSPRDGKTIEDVGIYHPLSKENEQIKFDNEKVKKWFLNGAKPTQIVKRLLNKKGFRFDRKLILNEK